MSARLGLEFVDTNILIYAYDKSAGEKHRLASQLVTGLWRSRIGCLSVQVLQELYVVGARKLTQIAPADLRLILTELGLWRVYSPGAMDVISAVDLHDRYQISFWDAMILHSARQLGCIVVWSEDLNPGQYYHDVRVLNPFGLVKPAQS